MHINLQLEEINQIRQNTNYQKLNQDEIDNLNLAIKRN